MAKRVLKVAAVLVALMGLVESASYATLPRSVLVKRNKDGKVLVVATTATLADIANYVGGRRVYVTSLTDGFPPQSEPKAEYRSVADALKEAQVVLRLGDAYDPWIHNLVNASGNMAIAAGTSGDVDASADISGLANQSCGHSAYYWLDPANARLVSARVLASFEQASPKDAEYFRHNHEAFCRKLDEKTSEWKATLAPYKDTKMITSCGALVSFRTRFGLKNSASVEAGSVCRMKNPRAKESNTGDMRFFRIADSSAANADAPVLVLPGSVKSGGHTRDYFKMMDALVGRLAVALDAQLQ